MSKGRVLSGIQPTGGFHIGNYLGALKQWVELQQDYDCVYCIVDLHAMTVAQKDSKLYQNTFNAAVLCLAVGIDPKRSILFVQSDVPQHAELTWMLNCFTYMGELRRMTQFKDKTKGEADSANINVGLFDYPVLMISDILLYSATHVPVGEDQQQHLELTRDIAVRLNNLYKKLFVVPEAVIPKKGARIMALDDPAKKMSKSATSTYGYIMLEDPPDKVRAKIKSAVTDSGREILYDPKTKPALANLLDIFSLVSGKPLNELQNYYGDKGYAVFKKDLAEAVVEFLTPIQRQIAYWKGQPQEVEAILKEGAIKAQKLASEKVKQVKSAIGLGVQKLPTAIKAP